MDKMLLLENLKLQRLRLKQEINWQSKSVKGKEKGKTGMAKFFSKSFEHRDCGHCIVSQAHKCLLEEPVPDEGSAAEQEIHCCVNNDGCNSAAAAKQSLKAALLRRNGAHSREPGNTRDNWETSRGQVGDN